MNIVFVHLNTTLPKYLILNIKAHIAKFPDHKITLIHNEEVKVPKIEELETYLYYPDEEWNLLEQLYTHSKDFRGNFWLTSTARFFALQSYAGVFDEELLHLESDVVLARDFPFEKFSSISEGIAYPLISQERGVASVLYLRNKFHADILTSIVIPEARRDSKTTEMLMLRKLYNSNPQQIRVLPIGPRDESAYAGISSELWQQSQQSFDTFEGCFDGVDIGQFFFGTDPRNRRGRVLLRQDIVNGYAKIADWALSFSQLRNFPKVSRRSGTGEVNIFALHLPSKKKSLFNARSQERFIKKACKDSTKESRNTFYLGTFTQSLFKAIPRRFTKTIKSLTIYSSVKALASRRLRK